MAIGVISHRCLHPLKLVYNGGSPDMATGGRTCSGTKLSRPGNGRRLYGWNEGGRGLRGRSWRGMVMN